MLDRGDDRLGSVTPGKQADLVLVKGDPARAIEGIRNTVVVMKAGRLFRAAELQEAIGMRPPLR